MNRWICVDDICIPSDENDWEELVTFADAIAEQEPIDIVRCKECRWAYPRTLPGETGYRCVFYNVLKAHNGYCDNGESR